MFSVRDCFSLSLTFGKRYAALTWSKEAASSSTKRTSVASNDCARSAIPLQSAATLANFGEPLVSKATMRIKPAPNAPIAAETLPPPGVGSADASLFAKASSESAVSGTKLSHHHRTRPSRFGADGMGVLVRRPCSHGAYNERRTPHLGLPGLTSLQAIV